MPPGACPGGQAILTSQCSQACVLCDLDGFSGTNSITTPGQAPDGFCAPQLHNTQWIGFVAGSESLSMNISVFGCDQGDGLQIGIYNTLDCTDFTLVSNCEAAIPDGTTAFFNTNVPLQIGGIYFLVIDGNFGDICEFSVDITSGSTVAPDVSGFAFINNPPGPYCPGGSYTYTASTVEFASVYTWTVNGVEVGYTQSLDIVFPTEGFYDICVTPSHPCSSAGQPVCTQALVQNPPPLNQDETICDGETFTLGGQVFSQAGFYSVMNTLPSGCTQEVFLQLEVEQPSFTFEEAHICLGEIYWVGTPGQPGSQSFNQSNVYNVVLPSFHGCDSTVNLLLEVHNPTLEIFNESICEGESVFFAGTTYTETGSYVHNLTSFYDCDSTVVLVLDVSPQPEPTYLDETICEGDFYILGNAAYDDPGLYTAFLTTPSGCDSAVTLQLNVSAPLTELVETICPGESYTVGTTDYNSTGLYSQMLVSSLGCDSTVNLDLTVQPMIETELDETICDGEIYTVGSTDYTSTGSFTETLTAESGCDSVVSLNLTVNPILQTLLTETVCDGAIFSVGNSTYSNSGSYTDILTSVLTGCDSIVNLDLTIAPPIETTLTEAICDGEVYTVGTTDFSNGGAHQVVLTANDGCDSTVFLDLTILSLPETFLTISICEGDSYQVGNSDYSAVGSYVDVLTAANSCDSFVYLDLAIIPTVTTLLNEAICTGQSFSVGNSTYNTGGTYEDILTAASGCDSVITLNLTVTNLLEEFLTISICDGDTYEVGNSSYSASGNFQNAFITPDGCDSIVYLNLTVFDIPETTLDISICDGETYTVGANNFNTTGNYTETLTSNITGCDSLVYLNLDVLNVPQTSLTQSICDGTSYFVGNSEYSASGSFQDILQAENGCDSIVSLQLTVLDVPQTDLTESICDGTTYLVGASEYAASGIYQDVLQAANGCDSIVNLALTVLNVPEVALTELICDGEIFPVGASNYTNSGIYVDTLVAVNGCDSIVALDLTVAEIPVTNIETSICDGGAYSVGNSSYSATGVYQDVLISEFGCDSIVNLELTVTSFYETNLVENLCDGASYTVGASVYSSSGIYQDMFTSTDGCDSIVNLDLTVFAIPETNLDITICDGENYLVGNSTYASTGVFQDVLTAFTGCDSIVNLELTVNAVFETNLIEAICEGETYLVGASNYNQSGVYQDLLVASNGCDSVVNLDLIVFDIPMTSLTEIICNGDTYLVGNSTYNASGTYQDVLTAFTGCDSVVSLELTVLDLNETSLVEVLCNGDTYDVGTSNYTASGIYQDVLTAENGCDSIVNLELTIRDLIETDLTADICDGEIYTVGSSDYSNTGNFQDILTSITTGCDSVVSLALNVIPIEETFLTEDICDGESFEVGNSSYTAQGIYQDVVTASTGCDSIINLDLTVYDIPQTSLVETICFGETYLVGNSTYNASGDFQDVLTALTTGCDSVVSLQLTILPEVLTNLDEVICFGESFAVGNSAYANSGVYQDVLTDQNGCDSTVNLNLLIRDLIETELATDICDGETYSVGSSDYTATGNYQDILTSTTTGCDSVVNLALNVIPIEETFLTEDICDGESFEVGNSNYTTQGIYQDVITASTGCDSIINLDLTVYDIPQTSLVETICFGETYLVGNSTYNASGDFQDVLTALTTGCDSVVSLQLTVLPEVLTDLDEVICFGESFAVGNSTYANSGVYQDVLTDQNGCDSTVNLNLLIRNIIETDLATDICDGETYSVGSSDYTATGNYQDILTSITTGCDSVVNLALNVIPIEETFLTEDICDGESFEVGNSNYTTQGIYQDIVPASTGCDSIINLDLTVYDIPQTSLVETICFGETYLVGNSTYNASGAYQDVLTALTTGCDSVSWHYRCCSNYHR